jgi:hypothetical protein
VLDKRCLGAGLLTEPVIEVGGVDLQASPVGFAQNEVEEGEGIAAT